MAKTTAPLMGFSASGQLAKSIVHSKWKGVTYARQHVIPANPRSAKQTKVRNAFTYLSACYKQAAPQVHDVSRTAAKGQPKTDRNVFIALNLPLISQDTDSTHMRISGGTGGSPAALTAVVTPGSGQLSVAITVPANPSGWSLDFLVVAAWISSVNPQLKAATIIHAAQANSSPVVITGLTTVLHQVRVWPAWVRPDITIGYGADISATGTPT